VVVVRRVAPDGRRRGWRLVRPGPDARALGTDGDRLPTWLGGGLGRPTLLGERSGGCPGLLLALRLLGLRRTRTEGLALVATLRPPTLEPCGDHRDPDLVTEGV